MNLPEHAGDELLDKLTALYGEALKTDPTIGGRLHELEFQLTSQDEQNLSTVSMERVGQPIAATILLHGVRGALPQIYGISIVWDAKKTRLCRRHADPED